MSDRIPLSFRRFWHGTENQSKSKRFNSRLDLVKGFTGNEEMKRAHYKDVSRLVVRDRHT